MRNITYYNLFAVFWALLDPFFGPWIFVPKKPFRGHRRIRKPFRQGRMGLQWGSNGAPMGHLKVLKLSSMSGGGIDLQK